MMGLIALKRRRWVGHPTVCGGHSAPAQVSFLASRRPLSADVFCCWRLKLPRPWRPLPRKAAARAAWASWTTCWRAAPEASATSKAAWRRKTTGPRPEALEWPQSRAGLRASLATARTQKRSGPQGRRDMRVSGGCEKPLRPTSKGRHGGVTPHLEAFLEMTSNPS